jgi:hypothetical protein
MSVFDGARQGAFTGQAVSLEQLVEVKAGALMVVVRKTVCHVWPWTAGMAHRINKTRRADRKQCVVRDIVDAPRD